MTCSFVRGIGLLGVCLFVSLCSARGQEQEECVPAPPATFLERFSAQSGVVLIRGFSKIGSIRGRGSVTVAAIEIRLASNPKIRATGLSFTVSESSAKEKTSFVDYDEIDSLLEGIEYISGADHNISHLANFIANFKTKGEFSVATYGTGSGIHLAVSSGTCGRITAHFETTELTQLKSLIENGKAAIDSAQEVSH